MKILKKTGIVLTVLILLLVIISFFLPDHVHIKRSTVIKVSDEIVFEQVNNLKKWQQWSPWFERDPHMKATYEGPAWGKGAVYKWDSEQSDVGTGSMKIIESVPNSKVVIELDFMEKGTAIAAHVFENTPEGTKVTWSMDSDMGLNPIGRYMGLMMDGMVGKEYEKGLAKLKNICEKEAL